MESIRKDVECTFGILKKRFSILKNKFRVHKMEDISWIFCCCCILHNMLMEWDGLDDWKEMEDYYNALMDITEHLDMVTMRDHGWYGFYNDLPANEGAEHDHEFDRRRAALIEHFNYCKRHNIS